jgi:hypothetical protein
MMSMPQVSLHWPPSALMAYFARIRRSASAFNSGNGLFEKSGFIACHEENPGKHEYLLDISRVFGYLSEH